VPIRSPWVQHRLDYRGHPPRHCGLMFAALMIGHRVGDD